MTVVKEDARAESIARRALASWGLGHAELNLLKYRENAVFKVSVNGVCNSVLRIHRPSYHDREALQSEVLWMQALNNAGISAPRVRPTLNGDPVTEITDTDSTYLCDLIDWIAGVPLDSIDEETDTDSAKLVEAYQVLGGIAGRVHNQSSAWVPPANFKRHSWNAEGLIGDHPVWGDFRMLTVLTSQQLDLLASARRKLRAELDELGENPLYYGLIHADMLTDNILVDGHTFSLIDFDDCGYGWHLFEFATPLFFYLGEPIFDDLRSAFVAGYRQQRDMPDEHLSHLDAFFLARGFTYLGWLHTRKETGTAKALTADVVTAVLALAEDYLQA